MKDSSGIWVALECSNRWAEGIVWEEGELHEFCLEENQSQSADLVPMLKSTLEGLKIDPKAVTDLVLNIGPGSATGLRMGVALAQGWSLVYPELRIHASTLEACALEAMEEWIGVEDTASKAVLLSDAFGGEVFLQHLECEGKAWLGLGEMARHPRDVIESLEGPMWVLEDLGAWKEKMDWSAGLKRFDGKFPSVRHVLRAAQSGDLLRDIEDVDVRYLKPSSAELLWEKRNSKKG
jgi:tRNA A37 threonylcarbamoyladenosine modification protein TsaB